VKNTEYNVGVIQKHKNLYYICYIVNVIEKNRIVCYNMKVKNIYTYHFNQIFIKIIVHNLYLYILAQSK